MIIGVNVTSPRGFAFAHAFWDEGLIGYYELMLDNFLRVDPVLLARELDGRPAAIHIMSSRFLHRTAEELAELAARMRPLLAAVRPLYVSDHLGVHMAGGQFLPDMVEADYHRPRPLLEAAARWQDLLGYDLLLENFPSCSPHGGGQVAFFAELARATGIRPLLDLSNALVAERNGADPAADWLTCGPPVAHCHISGYRPSDLDPSFIVDSHDRPVAEEAWRLLESAGDAVATLTVERDRIDDLDEWRADLRRARLTAGVGA
ncbi:DUF692 family multinuclear iron-containing protein [Nonomuraea sp. NPDC050783]|uniref:multinuclear nonheme iron-dependent oxidase n=1 Tax=Nonomuraea sp. NPDC050783 TaxID=3154634 RepID=UPI00346768FF